MPLANEKQFLYQLIISQLYYDGHKAHASLLEEAILDTHQSVLPSDNLRSLLTACSNTIRTADVIFNNWFKAKKCTDMPEISSQPLGQSLLQLYSNSLQPTPINISNAPSFEQAKQKQKRQQQPTTQRQQINQAQQQQMKQIHQQQQLQAAQQQQASQHTPVISLPSFQFSSETTQTASPSCKQPHLSPQMGKPKTAPLPASQIGMNKESLITTEVSAKTVPIPTSINLPTFSEYASELNDVLQVSSEVLNITSSSPKSKDNPGSPIDVTAFLNVDSKVPVTPPTINTSPISNPDTREQMEMDTISETQDLLDKLTSLSSSGKLSETSILQKLSPSQISLLTSHLESQTSFKPDKPKKIPSAIVDPAPLQQLEDLNKNEGIITLGGVNKEQLSMELEDILSNSDRNSDQETGSVSGTESDKLGLRKPTISYPAMIAMAILNSDSKRLLLGDIYRFIMEKYPYYRLEGQGWRNSIRHNLSLNDCFMKAGRAESGKGHYWTVRPDSIKEFQNGGYRRRLRRTCTRGGSLSMSREVASAANHVRSSRNHVTSSRNHVTSSRPQISLAPFVSALKQELCGSAASSPGAVQQPAGTEHT